MEGYNKSSLLEILRLRVAEVKFRKLDGALRIIRGTLKDAFIPDEYLVKTPETRVRKENPNVVTLWDLDAHAWRSFRTDRVLEVF